MTVDELVKFMNGNMLAAALAIAVVYLWRDNRRLNRLYTACMIEKASEEDARRIEAEAKMK